MSHRQPPVSLQDLLLSEKKKVQRMEKAINYGNNKLGIEVASAEPGGRKNSLL